MRPDTFAALGIYQALIAVPLARAALELAVPAKTRRTRTRPG